jgi:hypothetical protein
MTAKINSVETAKKADVRKVLDGAMNKSQKIRALNAMEVPRAEIAVLLDIKYQFVRNVLNQIPPTKK